MLEQIQLLLKLQNLDSEEMTLQKKLDEIPKKIEHAWELLNSEAARFKEIKGAKETNEQRQQSLKKEMAVYEEEAKKRENRLYNLKSDDAFRILMREIQNLRKGKKVLEEEQCHVMEELKIINDEWGPLQEKLDILKNEQETLLQSLEGKREELLCVLVSLRKQSEQLKASLNGACCKHYELIKTKRLMPMVVPARKGTCYGCFMNIPPQLYNKVQSNRELLVCPSCQRILYFDKNGELDFEREVAML